MEFKEWEINIGVESVLENKIHKQILHSVSII